MTIEPTYGYYIYCVIELSERKSFNNIGIEKREVVSIPYNNIACVVHHCEAKPYDSKDPNVVRTLIESHNNVIEKIWKEYKTVLPFKFNTIIKITDEANPEKNVINWLKENEKILEEKLFKLKDKAEYGIQIFWDTKIISEKVIKENQELNALKASIDQMSEGKAYMQKEKLERLLRLKLEEELNKKYMEFYEIIKPCVFDSKIEKIKKETDKEMMLLNISCLVIDVKLLGEELEKIQKIKGYRVRFTGPWPPYSFA